MLLCSEFALDVPLPFSTLHFFIYIKSNKLLPSSKECCENPGTSSCLDMIRMAVKCPHEEENTEFLCLCGVRAALTRYKEFKEAEWGERRGKVKKLTKTYLKPSPISDVFAAGCSLTPEQRVAASCLQNSFLSLSSEELVNFA